MTQIARPAPRRLDAFELPSEPGNERLALARVAESVRGLGLGQRLGLPDPKVEIKTTCVDAKRQWRHANNIWHNSMIRSVLQTMAAPVIGLAHMVRRDKSTAQT